MTSRRGATGLAGLLCIDKPAGITSHDVVSSLRRATGERRIGHAGTLDPMATGLMLVLVGPATRLERYLSGQDKQYEARISFGTLTDTLDADGKPVRTAPVPEALFAAPAAQAVLDSFLGPSQQMPPAYSAIKTGGVPAHRRARSGEEPILAPRPIVVYEALLRGADAEHRTWDVAFRVSKGTYIRALARDIGEAAGTVAHLSGLRRTRIGTCEVAEAFSLDDAIALAEKGRLPEAFVDPVAPLGMGVVVTDPSAVADGRSLDAAHGTLPEGERIALVTEDRLLAIYRTDAGSLRAETVLGAGVVR